MILIKKNEDFNIKRIAESGQCFRWEEIRQNTYRIIAFGKVLHIIYHEESGELELDCKEEDLESCWNSYFHLDLDYAKLRQSIPDTDAYLYAAAEYGKGIRILRQDPWETLITFIISQRKNIPAIKQAVSRLCSLAGDKITCIDGEDIFSFPSPEQIAGMSEETLGFCKLGYRAKYIRRTAEDFAMGKHSIALMEKMKDEDLIHELTSLFGVGTKVAECTALFGFHRLNFFPKDVWIHRVLEEQYADGFDFDAYAPYNGIMQQYLFYYSRKPS